MPEILTSLAMPDTAGEALLQRNDDAAATVNRLRLAGTAGWSAIGQAAALASLRTLMPPGLAVLIVAYIFEQSVYELFGLMIGPVLVIALLIFLLALFGGRDKKATRGDPDEAEWRSLVWLVVTPLILAVILGGIVTPAEAGAFAVALAILLGLVLRQLSVRLFFRATLDALYDTGAIFLVVIFAKGLSLAIAFEITPDAVAGWASAFSPELALAGVIVLVIVTGAMTGLLITLFVLGPLITIFLLATSVGGYQAVSLAILIAATIGLSIPPAGAIFATLAAGTTEPVHRIVRGVAVFTIPLLVALVAMALLR